MPFDQHCLVSLVAPRALYIGGVLDDTWADNENQFLTCAAASELWKFYDKNGLISPDALPECGDVLTDGELGFHLREGSTSTAARIGSYI